MIDKTRQEDALHLIHIKQQVWPDEPADMQRIERALQHPGHVTFTARLASKVVGFVDAFPSIDVDGRKRWEIDLLAVDQEFQGRQIGQRLIRAATAAGQQAGAAFARALVQTKNAACQVAMQRCDYATDGRVYQLMVSSEKVEPVGNLPPAEAHLVYVETMNYSGLWLEGLLSANALLAGQSLRTQRRLDLVGALIPVDQVDLLAAAGSLGYQPVERFHWWVNRF